MIKKIGVIGAGQMGNGIAHVAALAGYEVKLLDVEQERLDKGLVTIGRNMDRQIRRKTIRSPGSRPVWTMRYSATATLSSRQRRRTRRSSARSSRPWCRT